MKKKRTEKISEKPEEMKNDNADDDDNNNDEDDEIEEQSESYVLTLSQKMIDETNSETLLYQSQFEHCSQVKSLIPSFFYEYLKIEKEKIFSSVIYYWFSRSQKWI